MNVMDLIQGLADGRLTETEKAEAQRRMETDSVFRAEVESYAALRSALKKDCKSVRCEETWKICVDRLNELDRNQKAEAFIGRYAWGLAACLFVVLVGAGISNWKNPEKLLTPSDVPAMAAGMRPLDLSGGDRTLTESGLRLPPNQLELTGYAEGIHDGKKVRRLDLVDRRGRLALWLVQDSGTSTDPTIERGQSMALNYVTWKSGRFVALLMGDRSASELEQLASTLKFN